MYVEINYDDSTVGPSERQYGTMRAEAGVWMKSFMEN